MKNLLELIKDNVLYLENNDEKVNVELLCDGEEFVISIPSKYVYLVLSNNKYPRPITAKLSFTQKSEYFHIVQVDNGIITLVEDRPGGKILPNDNLVQVGMEPDLDAIGFGSSNPKQKVYEYMVTYAIANGTGRTCLTRSSEISSYEDVQSIDVTIEQTFGKKCTVLDFKLLRTFMV